MFEGSISVHNKERVTQMVNIFTTEHQQWTPYHWFRSLSTVLAQLYIITLISFPCVSGQLRETFLTCSVKSPWYCGAIAQFSCVSLWGARSSTLELVWAFHWHVCWFSEMYFHQMYKAKIKILLCEDNICLSCQAALVHLNASLIQKIINLWELWLALLGFCGIVAMVEASEHLVQSNNILKVSIFILGMLIERWMLWIRVVGSL